MPTPGDPSGPCKWAIESSQTIKGGKTEVHLKCTNHNPPHEKYETK